MNRHRFIEIASLKCEKRKRRRVWGNGKLSESDERSKLWVKSEHCLAFFSDFSPQTSINFESFFFVISSGCGMVWGWIQVIDWFSSQSVFFYLMVIHSNLNKIEWNHNWKCWKLINFMTLSRNAPLNCWVWQQQNKNHDFRQSWNDFPSNVS